MPYDEITELMHEIQADVDAKHVEKQVTSHVQGLVNAHIQEQIDAGHWKFSVYRIPHLHSPCTYSREVYRRYFLCPEGISWEYQGTFDDFNIIDTDSTVERVAKVLAILGRRMLECE